MVPRFHESRESVSALRPTLAETETENETGINTDTDDDVFSSGEVSLPSSASATSFDTDSMEALLLIFIDDGNLQYLWAQLVQVAGATQSKQVILELIRQYGDNLYREATIKLESNTKPLRQGLRCENCRTDLFCLRTQGKTFFGSEPDVA